MVVLLILLFLHAKCDYFMLKILKTQNKCNFVKNKIYMQHKYPPPLWLNLQSAAIMGNILSLIYEKLKPYMKFSVN